MNNYKELIDLLRIVDGVPEDFKDVCSYAADAIEQLVKERDYIPTDTLRKYHAWLLEKYHKNPTSENLHSIDTAISWLKVYGDFKDINVCFGV